MSAWTELRIEGLARRDLERVSAQLFALGAVGLQEDWMPGRAPPPPQPWSPQEPAPPDPLVVIAWFCAEAPGAIRTNLTDIPAVLSWRRVEDQDWESGFRASVVPIQITADLVIAPPWDAPEGALIIEPGQGFGTGRHPTTRQALVAIEALAAGHTTLLDVGTGSGILALAAARRGLQAEGIDVDRAAIEDARRQAQANGLSVVLSTTPLDRLEQVYDLVVANLHAELLVTLVRPLQARARHHLVLAGILSDRRAAVRDAFDPWFGEPHEDNERGWTCLWYPVR